MSEAFRKQIAADVAEKQIVHIENGRLSGKEFERIVVARNHEYKKQRLACVGRYGVQCSHTQEGPVAIKSLPDFEGVTVDPFRHVIFDTKVCSQASMGLHKYRREVQGARRRQLKHMLERDEFGCVCGFLIHWNERQTKTKYEAPETFFFPVSYESNYWQQFEAGELKSLNRADCRLYGSEVAWNKLGRARTPRPDWLLAVSSLESTNE